MSSSVRRELTERQRTLLTAMVGVAGTDNVRDWLNRVLAGSRSPQPTSRLEVDELYRIINRAETFEVTGEFKP